MRHKHLGPAPRYVIVQLDPSGRVVAAATIQTRAVESIPSRISTNGQVITLHGRVIATSESDLRVIAKVPPVGEPIRRVEHRDFTDPDGFEYESDLVS